MNVTKVSVKQGTYFYGKWNITDVLFVYGHVEDLMYCCSAKHSVNYKVLWITMGLKLCFKDNRNIANKPFNKKCITTSVHVQMGWRKVLFTQWEKLVNNSLISFWNYKSQFQWIRFKCLVGYYYQSITSMKKKMLIHLLIFFVEITH